jgi:hypothetical protein
MAETYQPLEMRDKHGEPLGRWRMTVRSDEDDAPPIGLCSCEAGHGSPAESGECPEAKAAMAGVFPKRTDRAAEIKAAEAEITAALHEYVARGRSYTDTIERMHRALDPFRPPKHG